MHITKSDLEKARQVKAIIEKEYHKHYTYQDLAQQVGTNPGKLQEAFKMVTGKNLYEYLAAIRVQQAMELLENTELKVETIASKVGWDKTNLNKQFKKIAGITPGAWRLNHENMDHPYKQSG